MDLKKENNLILVVGKTEGHLDQSIFAINFLNEKKGPPPVVNLFNEKNNGETVLKLIKEAMPDAKIEIQDLAGDGNHYSATVTSSTFVGKSKIEQHKMVYNSLKGKMGNELHALAIKTKEWNGTTNKRFNQ